MESLNYTQLASVVLVLSVASLLLFIISLILVLIIRKQKKSLYFLNKRIDGVVERIESTCKSADFSIQQVHLRVDSAIKTFSSNEADLKDRFFKHIDIVKKNTYDHLEARINTLFKPAYAIGDKVETADGIKGTITHISRDKDGFMYEITERSYFNRPAKKHNRIEFLLMKS